MADRRPGFPVGIEIVLESPDMRPPADQEVLRALMAKGGISTVIFVTDDCHAT